MTSASLYWHYTVGQRVVSIVDDGFLDPKRTVSAGERPFVWFSAHQFWEPTASKAWMGRDGSVRTLTMQEMCELGGGLVRFGLPKHRLIPWPKIGRRSGMSAETIAKLDEVGRLQGADPTHWAGAFKRIAVDECEAVEVMSDDFSGWQSIPNWDEEAA